MNHKSISPNPQQPVDRVPAGQLPSALAQLSEEALGGTVAPAAGGFPCYPCACSYDGDDVAPAGFPVLCVCSYDGDDA